MVAQEDCELRTAQDVFASWTCKNVSCDVVSVMLQNVINPDGSASSREEEMTKDSWETQSLTNKLVLRREQRDKTIRILSLFCKCLFLCHITVMESIYIQKLK